MASSSRTDMAILAPVGTFAGNIAKLDERLDTYPLLCKQKKVENVRDLRLAPRAYQKKALVHIGGLPCIQLRTKFQGGCFKWGQSVA